MAKKPYFTGVLLARPRELESPAFCSGGRRSIQLSYGRMSYSIFTRKNKDTTQICSSQEYSYYASSRKILRSSACSLSLIFSPFST